MSRLNPIHVLIVDDSAMARDLMREILSGIPDINVAGEARNGLEAVNMAATLKPDIITMDIEMPVMGGLEAIEKIMAAGPVPILVVTSHNDLHTAFMAVSKGALEAVEKPDISAESALRLIRKIRTLADVNVANIRAMAPGSGVRPAASNPVMPIAATASSRFAPALQPADRSVAIIAIAASTGGPQALQYILSTLPGSLPVPVVITQHVAEGFAAGMATWFNASSSLTVKLPVDGEKICGGTVYLNPSENSMTVDAAGVIHLGARDHSNIYNPSCNVMLQSVAKSFGRRAIALIMSGMGDDGADGMVAIKQQGGITLAQDEASSVVFGMNQQAVVRGCIDQIVPLAQIPDLLLHKTGCR